MPETTDSEQRKRNIAYRLRVGDIVNAKPISIDGKLIYVDYGGKKVLRVNVIANVVEKFVNDGEKKYASVTVDDASGQIRLKSFGEDISILKEVSQGDTLQIIGLVREYNGELYLSPEIIKIVESKWNLVRKLEIQKRQRENPPPKEVSVKDMILEKIKNKDTSGGIEKEQIILELDVSPEIINSEISQMQENGMIYESRPGVFRYLG